MLVCIYRVMTCVIGGSSDVIERLVSDDAVDGADAWQTVSRTDAVRHQSDTSHHCHY